MKNVQKGQEQRILLLILRRGLQLSTEKYSQKSSRYILFPRKAKDEASTSKYMLWP